VHTATGFPYAMAGAALFVRLLKGWSWLSARGKAWLDHDTRHRLQHPAGAVFR